MCSTSSPSQLRRSRRLALDLLIVLGGLLLAAAASAAESYTLTYGYPSTDHTESSPMRFNGFFVDANGSYGEIATAIPDHALADSHTESTYGGVEVRAFSSADDFIITGPGSGSVIATVHFRLHVDLGSSGPPDNDAINAQGWFVFLTNYLGYPTQVVGTAFSGNHSRSGTGFLASYTGGVVNAPVDLNVSLPIGQPFRIEIRLSASSQAYAGICDTHGQFSGDLGDASGKVMDLPSGYTVNSTSWGVVDNVLVGVTAVSDRQAPTLNWERPVPNPSRGPLTLAYSLPRAGTAQVDILDLQGRVVRSLAGGAQPSGTRRVTWDGLDAGGARAKAGIYFARVRFEGRAAICRLARLE
jgi:hypothetical protein